MSPRAAWRLEQRGFRTYDYVAGKSDWLAWDLPYEGTADLVGAHVEREVATVAPDQQLAAVRDRLEAATDGFLVVVNDHGVVLGRLSRSAADSAADDVPVAAVMREGPTTVRPSSGYDDLLHRMEHASVATVMVTRSDGVLLGVLRRP